MSVKKIIFFVIFLLYQTTSYSQSNSFNNLNAKNFSKYFSELLLLRIMTIQDLSNFLRRPKFY